jgi:hypothetical protein
VVVAAHWCQLLIDISKTSRIKSGGRRKKFLAKMLGLMEKYNFDGGIYQGFFDLICLTESIVWFSGEFA